MPDFLICRPKKQQRSSKLLLRIVKRSSDSLALVGSCHVWVCFSANVHGVNVLSLLLNECTRQQCWTVVIVLFEIGLNVCCMKEYWCVVVCWSQHWLNTLNNYIVTCTLSCISIRNCMCLNVCCWWLWVLSAV